MAISASAGAAFSSAFERHLGDKGVERRLQRGAILHLAGEPCERVHVVRSGIVLQMSRDAAGGETVLGLVGPDEIIDPSSAIDGLPHHFDALAATDCIVEGVASDRFRSALSRDPLMTLAVARVLAEKMRWASDTAHERAAQQVSGRVAGRLLELARLLGEQRGEWIELHLPIDQSTFARLAGTSRESTCKTLRRFKADGVVDYEGRRLRILRPDALRHMRCAGKR